MSAIGPELPPHLLAKRKRQEDAGLEDANTTRSGANRSPSPVGQDKRRRVMGPAMPPAPIDQMPSTRPHAGIGATSDHSDSDSDSDSDLGPALPPADYDAAQESERVNDAGASEATSTATAAPQRDEWMTMAPQQDDLAARMDPARQRPRGFNTGKSARRGAAPEGPDGTAWHETPEQRRQRLADEMMGVAKPVAGGRGGGGTRKEEAEPGRKVKAGEAKMRGPTLLEQHQHGKGADGSGLDDDPSKRAFDREKDMASGGQISATKRRELLSKAGDFSSRFSSGGLL